MLYVHILHSYNIIKTILIEIFTSSFALSDDVTLSGNNSVLFFLTQAVTAVKTVMKVLFSLVEINTEMLSRKLNLSLMIKILSWQGMSMG